MSSRSYLKFRIQYLVAQIENRTEHISLDKICYQGTIQFIGIQFTLSIHVSHKNSITTRYWLWLLLSYWKLYAELQTVTLSINNVFP